MKLNAVIICMALSLGLAIVANFGLPSSGVVEESARASERLEELAFKKGGSPELQAAVGDLRDADKQLFVEGAIQWLLQLVSAVSGLIALGLCIWRANKDAEPAAAMKPGRSSRRCAV